MQVGSKVRYIGPSLFSSGAGWVGTVARMPLERPSNPRRLDDGMAMVQAAGQPRPRPVRLDQLAEISSDG